ncbi:MAG: DEAD/DEAH box helicase [Polyangiaceae bacterium]|nr:DEAD/DEAH box helicase [Polyangiaceae bacterium]
MARDPLSSFHEPVRTWFRSTLGEPTEAQRKGWAPIVEGRSTLLLAPTGSGKTLAAFLTAVDKLMFSPEPPKKERCRVVYISPLKALGADVERNLRIPLAGISQTAGQLGAAHRSLNVAVRSGDTPASERARIGRSPPDILIITPESFYLLLTSSAREIVRWVDTVIVDEIHSLVSTKRGAHLTLSLERLEALREPGRPTLQRIGLSATQRPLEHVARMLGGNTVSAGGLVSQRPVDIVNAGMKKAWEFVVTVPVDDMSKLGTPEPRGQKKAPDEPTQKSIWPSIHPKLVELIRAHRSTMIFVNSRRLAERLAQAINDVAEEEIALAHYGSVAKEKRRDIEERLKSGNLPAIIATSSLELGLDLGAVDLVIQIEAPPSIASGLQRIGRAGHSVGAVSRGVIFPKYRGDLLAAAAATEKMAQAEVESTIYLQNPLDVLAQQVVAIVSVEPADIEDLYSLVRRSVCFTDLPRSSFEGVLDMLSGKYPSDEFAELRPRISWDRSTGRLRARDGARRIAVVNGGTIPDRGLYGVYLAGEKEGKGSRRVGELDEEMVFESHVGEVFLLGASSWRIEEITHDRVLVSPAPGQPGKMPFWHGDRPGRPAELGKAIGTLARTLVAESRDKAVERLKTRHGLDERAATNLVQYVTDQALATGEVPSDKTLVIERYLDEMGTLCVCVLSPFGARVHAPWSQAVLSQLHGDKYPTAEGIWSDDGMVFRLPDSTEPPPDNLFLPAADGVTDLIIQGLAHTSLFGAHFRENAARALLLPRRRPGERTPLWAQRKKAGDLLSVAAKFPTFPILLETYRECLRDVFDLPALVDLLQQIQTKRIRVRSVNSKTPSPFASSLLFSYVANFIYDGDAPLAERRAHALAVDATQLRELLGEADLRELLDPDALVETEKNLQRLDGKRPAYSPDSLHDLLLSIGDLTHAEIAARSESPADVALWLNDLTSEHRVIACDVAGETRVIAIEDASRYRDALGVKLPRSIPKAFLVPVADPLGDLISRYARTHSPFLPEQPALRLGLGIAPVREVLARLIAAGRLVEGEFTSGRKVREVCDAEVLRTLKRKSLAKLRREIEPVSHAALGRFSLDYQGLIRPRSGVEGLLSALEQLEGYPLHASVLESDILPSRVDRYRPGDLDMLCAAGEVVWIGLESSGASDGKIALILPEKLRLLAPRPRSATSEVAGRIRTLLATRGALFFSDLCAMTGAFPKDLLGALWELVWASEVTNDTLAPLRSLLAGPEQETESRRTILARGFRSRRTGPAGSEGRWSLLPHVRDVFHNDLTIKPPSDTERRTALAKTLLERYGVVTREAVGAEGVEGGFSAVYDIYKAMEESGKVRRGYFVSALGATQFAAPGAEDRLRGFRDSTENPACFMLAATDPANPYGAALPWPERQGAKPGRSAGAQVILWDGELIGYISKGESSLLTFLPTNEPSRSHAVDALTNMLASLVDRGRRRTLLFTQIDGESPEKCAILPNLQKAGFVLTGGGLFKRMNASRISP